MLFVVRSVVSAGCCLLVVVCRAKRVSCCVFFVSLYMTFVAFARCV